MRAWNALVVYTAINLSSILEKTAIPRFNDKNKENMRCLIRLQLQAKL
jgi:hypothetical protein